VAMDLSFNFSSGKRTCTVTELIFLMFMCESSELVKSDYCICCYSMSTSMLKLDFSKVQVFVTLLVRTFHDGCKLRILKSLFPLFE